jgi:hypothetical protein
LTYAKTGSAGTVQGPPFFWLGDTAWSASIAATQNDWQTYINAQATSPTGKPNTAFTVVHLAVSPKAAGTVDANGNPPFDVPADPSCQPDSSQAPSNCNDWDPRYWAALDDKIQYANQKGLVVFLAGIMEPLQKDLTYLTATPPAPTSQGLSTLAGNTAARYAGNFVVLSPGFDHQIAANLSLILKIGQILSNNAIFRGLVTNHPAGGSSLTDIKTLQSDSWLDFQMFQSGSAGTTDSTELTNITDRASSLALGLVAASPFKPVINGEAAYDGAIADPTNPSTVNHTPYRARQTAYLSFLSGAKGYSAGTCGILDWSTGIAGCTSGWTWSFGLTRETSVSMKDLRFILQSVNWQLLHPEHARIQNQAPTPDQKMVLAYDGSSAIVAYVPAEQSTIQIKFLAGGNSQVGTYRTVPGFSSAITQFGQSGWSYQWLSPRTGISAARTSPPVLVSPGIFSFTKPNCQNQDSLCDANDWVLRLIKGKSEDFSSLTALNLVASNEIGPTSGESRIVEYALDNLGNVMNQLEIGGQGTAVLGPPKIAYEPGGNSLVVWQSDGDDGTTVIGRVLDSLGNPVMAEFAVSSGGSAAPGHPTVTTLESGNFIVVWANWDENGGGPWIWYRLFDRNGFSLGLDQMAVNCELVAGDFPQVSPVSGGGFGVAWEMSGGAGIYFIQFDSDGDLVGDGQLAQGNSDWPALESIDMTTDSAFTISWGLYGSSGASSGGDTAQAVVVPTFCR